MRFVQPDQRSMGTHGFIWIEICMTSCHESFGVGGVSGARNNNLALGGQIIQIESTAEKWNCHGHLFDSLLVYRLPLSKKISNS